MRVSESILSFRFVAPLGPLPVYSHPGRESYFQKNNDCDLLCAQRLDVALGWVFGMPKHCHTGIAKGRPPLEPCRSDCTVPSPSLERSGGKSNGLVDKRIKDCSQMRFSANYATIRQHELADEALSIWREI